jgi:predicted 3-demethylubiquinone-9 3-methyltransferase (glyoxalase superfamily)
MPTLAPFLWFNDNAEEAATFYLSVFPHARKLSEVRSCNDESYRIGTLSQHS